LPCRAARSRAQAVGLATEVDRSPNVRSKLVSRAREEALREPRTHRCAALAPMGASDHPVMVARSHRNWSTRAGARVHLVNSGMIGPDNSTARVEELYGPLLT
jgi:hypothetical protein